MQKTLVLGKIWTAKGFFDWMTYCGGVIEQIGTGQPPSGSDQFVLVQVPKDQYILPGLIVNFSSYIKDAHIHIAMLGEFKQSSALDLSNVNTMEQLLQLLRVQKPQNGFIIGHGWDQSKLGQTLTRKDLDVISDPVILFRNCLHLCTLNSAALLYFQLLNDKMELDSNSEIFIETVNLLKLELEKSIQNPANGLFGIENGQTNGQVKEKCLFQIKKFFYLSNGKEIIESFFETGLQECLSKGLTSVQTNDFYDAWPVYKSLWNQNKIKSRVFLTVPADEIINQSDEVAVLANDEYGWISCHRVKIFADGSLGAKTAALREPYHKECQCGLLLESKENFLEKMKKTNDLGFRHEIHVIGDQACSVVLDYIEQLGLRNSILTHCQVLAPDLIERMKKLQVIANIQPSFVTSDASWVESVLGEERLPYSYCWKTLLDAGIHCSGGSDAPVEDCNPFFGIHAAIFRTFDFNSSQKPSEMKVFQPKERLKFIDAIQLYLKGAAGAAEEQDRLGDLAPGFKADFIFIDSPIWESDYERADETWHLLRNVQVLKVFVDGKLQYCRE